MIFYLKDKIVQTDQLKSFQKNLIEEYQKEANEPDRITHPEKNEITSIDTKEEIADAQNLAVNEILKIFIATLITLFKGRSFFSLLF